MAQTDRLGLPLLAAGQAQKELTHNDALALIDISVQLVVQSADSGTPPGSPVPGQSWIIATGATGDWSGRAGDIAAWTANGWLFARPRAGWSAWAIDRGNSLRFDGAAWADEGARADGYYVGDERIVGPRQAAIAAPAGGATQDDEARAAIASILAALRTHGLIAS